MRWCCKRRRRTGRSGKYIVVQEDPHNLSLLTHRRKRLQRSNKNMCKQRWMHQPKGEIRHRSQGEIRDETSAILFCRG